MPLYYLVSKIGATQAVQNAGLALITLFAGYIKDADNTYIWLEIFYIVWLALAVLTTALMWILDFRKHNYLNMSEKQRKVFETTPEFYESMHMDMPDKTQKP